MFCVFFRYTQLFTNIAGKIFTCFFIAGQQIIVLNKLRISENIRTKLRDYLVGLHSHKLRHESNIHLALSVNGYLQCFLRGIT